MPKRLVMAVFSIIMFVLCGYALCLGYPPQPYAKDFTGQSTDGTITLSNYLGYVIVIYFYSPS